MQRQLTRSLIRGTIAGWLCAAFLGALALSVLPQWHELLHPNAKAAQHECAVTLIAAGNLQQSAPAPLVVAPLPALQFSFVPALNPIWVASPFISARIFEHAPPALA
ncbi:MAG: hypothetical protein QOG51_801 [Verrucomicrobiota bacterium]|jgi:hypothetical protein